MALLSSSGKISGKCGDFVFRNYNGRTIVCARQGKQKKSNDPAVLARRSKFKLANKLGSTLVRHPAMKSIWNQFGGDKKLKAYNKMVKEFYPHVTGSDIYYTFHMCPFIPNLNVQSPNIMQKDYLLTAECRIAYSRFGLENISSVQLIALMFLTDPIDMNFPEYDILSFESDKVDFETDQKTKMEFKIREENTEIIDVYSERKMFYIFAAYDKNQNVIGFSSTFTFA
ncbi:MAG: hypothetical protein WC644_10805 [Ignavibacteria bacterium]